MLRLLRRSGVCRIAFTLSILVATVLAAVGLSNVGTGAAAGSSGPLGVYVGALSPGGVSTFGRAIGKQPTFAMDFLNGDSWSALVNSAPSYMSAWQGSGYTMIWGLPMLPDSGASLGQGATGAYNSHFLQLAQDMVSAGQGSSIIRPGWEFNGGWFPWAASGQAAAYVAYWQQIVNTMRSVPGQDFTFEWNPTAGDQGVGNLADYYPGNAYVDYIGLDLYDQSWGTFAGIASQWNTYLTEPYGLDWLASFAASRGKAITLPEWGLDPDPSSNDGGVVSELNSEVGGGDDPTFINDMAQWITQNQVFEATYWQYNSSVLGNLSNPNSFAAFVQDFGSGSGPTSGSGSGSATSTTTSGTTTPGTTTSTGVSGTTTSTGASGTTKPTTSSSGTSSLGSGAVGGGSVTSSSGSGSSPSGSQTSPGSGQAGSTVTIESPTGPISTGKGARFSAIIGAGGADTKGPSGSVSWAIRSHSGLTIPCHAESRLIDRSHRITRCNVGAGILTARDGPYRVSVSYSGSTGVAASSASVTQPVARANSRTRIHSKPVVRSGNPATITATVVGLPRWVGSATGRVTFSLAVKGGSAQSLSCAGSDTVSLVSGKATCAVATIAPAGSKCTVTATYSGDSTFNTSHSNARITVRRPRVATSGRSRRPSQ